MKEFRSDIFFLKNFEKYIFSDVLVFLRPILSNTFLNLLAFTLPLGILLPVLRSIFFFYRLFVRYNMA